MLPLMAIALPALMLVLPARLLQLTVTLAVTEFGMEVYVPVLMALTTMEFQRLVNPVLLHVSLAIVGSQLPVQAATVRCFGLSAFLQQVLASAPLRIMTQAY